MKWAASRDSRDALNVKHGVQGSAEEVDHAQGIQPPDIYTSRVSGNHGASEEAQILKAIELCPLSTSNALLRG